MKTIGTLALPRMDSLTRDLTHRADELNGKRAMRFMRDPNTGETADSEVFEFHSVIIYSFLQTPIEE